jgi:hypothetical protein
VLTKKTFTVRGREATSKVISVEHLEEGGDRLTVDTWCEGPDGLISHQSNTSTFFDLNDHIKLEAWLRNCAEWLVKLKWERPKIVKYLAQLLKVDGGAVNLLCDLNIEQPLTIVAPMFVEACGLPLTTYAIPPENRSARVPVHRAKFRFGRKEFEVDVLSVDMGVPGVIGRDLVLAALGANPEYIWDVFCSDAARVLRHASFAKQGTVLLLGSYSQPNRERLQVIRSEIGKSGFDAVLLSDFADIEYQSLPQKMLFLGSVARFVICDEFCASGHLVELQACADHKFVTALLRKDGKSPTWMNEDIAHGRDYMRVFPYSLDDELLESVKNATEWANLRVKDLAAYYNSLYPWRKAM